MPGGPTKSMSQMTRRELIFYAVACTVIGMAIASACVVFALHGIYWDWIGVVFAGIAVAYTLLKCRAELRRCKRP